MEKSKFTDERDAYALRQVESGTPVLDLSLVSSASVSKPSTFGKRYADTDVAEGGHLRQLEDESRRLKALVADLNSS